jgi:hydrogenase expression/formation protein HypD
MMEEAFRPETARWRGLGEIPASGFALKEELADLDAAKRFGIVPLDAKVQSGCRCGDVICGRLRPNDCPLFGKLCTPEDPVGPCMVSSEGACAAAYKYEECHG